MSTSIKMESTEPFVLILNIASFLITLTANVGFENFMKTSKRGFYCDDETIMKPLKKTSIEYATMRAICGVLVILTIVTVDICNYVIFSSNDKKKDRDGIKSCNIKIKHLIGRISFPSGNTVVTVYSTVLIGLYIQHLVRTECDMLKLLIQVLFICLASVVIWSQITDGFHHPVDVFAEAVLAVAFALYTIYILLDLPTEKNNLFPIVSTTSQNGFEADKEYEDESNEHLQLLSNS